MYKASHLLRFAAFLAVLLVVGSVVGSTATQVGSATETPIRMQSSGLTTWRGANESDHQVISAGLGGSVQASALAGFTNNPLGGGYWTAKAGGAVQAGGAAAWLGDMSNKALNSPVTGIAATPSGNGYWMVAADGGIFSFGDASYFGSMGGRSLNRPVIGMASTPSGRGYWLFASDGGIFSFGDASFFGSTGGTSLNKPIVAMTPLPDGNGYWLVASDGGVFCFGRAAFYGSAGSLPLNQPVVSALSTATGQGYWLVAADGGVFSYGDSAFYGSTGSLPNVTVVGLAQRAQKLPGYVIVGADGRTWEFGSGLSPVKPGACSTRSIGKPAASTVYAFEGIGNDGGPSRWSPCAPIHWKASLSQAPANGLAIVQQSFDKLSAATGLTFSYDGTTDTRSASIADSKVWSTGSSWNPVVIDFVPPGTPQMCGGAGCAYTTWQNLSDGSGTAFTSGAVLINNSIGSQFTPTVVLHELGHIVGLDHAGSGDQVMSTPATTPFTDYQAGDRAGLYWVGVGSTALAVPRV